MLNFTGHQSHQKLVLNSSASLHMTVPGQWLHGDVIHACTRQILGSKSYSVLGTADVMRAHSIPDYSNEISISGSIEASLFVHR